MCVMPTAVMQLNARLKKLVLKRFITSAITVFVVFMVIGRFVSGVHWFTDIIGGALLSTGLVLMYRAVVSLEVG
jgi:undecaprenyl-diphosphatase